MSYKIIHFMETLQKRSNTTKFLKAFQRLLMGVRASSVGSVLVNYTPSELHTISVRCRASPGSNIFRIAVEVRSVGMYVIWLSPGISRVAEMSHGFPLPQAALVTVASVKKRILDSMV